jgi:DNA-binding NarL/FixJ family response regulator
MSTAQIVIADDHELVREGLRKVLGTRPDWQVCGEAATGRQAVELANEKRPDLVILDISMPELNGLDAARQIRKESPRTEVLVLTMHDTDRLVRDVLAAGARGFILKSDAGRVLVQAVEALLNHRPFFTGKVAEMVLQGFLNPQDLAEGGQTEASQLTPRERQIVQLVAEGKSSKELAKALGISVRTAETHRTNIMRKLNAHSAAELVRYAIRNQITQP